MAHSYAGQFPAHLRSRGEHRPRTPTFSAATGPPPLARRALIQERVGVRLLRPTSARAESTPPTRSRPRVSPAHLRSRGEHTYPAAAATIADGPPPLARRALVVAAGPGARLRPTSARAESTAPEWRRRRWTPAHLRSRGEHPPGWALGARSPGPPPLARRARRDRGVRDDRDRPTSARAESTFATWPDTSALQLLYPASPCCRTAV